MARSCFSREVYASQKNCEKLVMKRTLLQIVSRYFQIAKMIFVLLEMSPMIHLDPLDYKFFVLDNIETVS